MFNGERAKIYWNFTLAWAVHYGANGWAIALSPDLSYLLVGSYSGTTGIIGKLNSSDGNVITTYSTPSSNNYTYIYTRDERALCLNLNGYF